MHIIPVIDVKDSVVVSARMGARESYQPMVTPLANGCAPVDVVRGLLGVYPFSVLYVADLDGIMGGAANENLIDEVSRAFPDLELWIDTGAATVSSAAPFLDKRNVRVVVGSESVGSLERAERLFKLAPNHCVLSLDLDGDGFLGPYELLTCPQVWPRTVIAMALGHVGSDAGPALEYVADVRRLAGASRRVYAAGGVRDFKDIEAVFRAGADGALIASALHGEKIKADDLGKIAGLSRSS